jgi:hypothetical protein
VVGVVVTSYDFRGRGRLTKRSADVRSFESLHPIAVVLIWINLLVRRDLGLIAKLTWAIAAIVPFVPFVYVLTGNDFI